MKDSSKQLVRIYCLICFDSCNIIKKNLFFSTALFYNPELYEDLAENFNFASPIIFYYDHLNSSARDLATEKIKDFYFENYITDKNYFNITNVMHFMMIWMRTISQSKCSINQFNWMFFCCSCMVMDGFYRQWTCIYVWDLRTTILHKPMCICWRIRQTLVLVVILLGIQINITVLDWQLIYSWFFLCVFLTQWMSSEL